MWRQLAVAVGYVVSMNAFLVGSRRLIDSKVINEWGLLWHLTLGILPQCLLQAPLFQSQQAASSSLIKGIGFNLLLPPHSAAPNYLVSWISLDSGSGVCVCLLLLLWGYTLIIKSIFFSVQALALASGACAFYFRSSLVSCIANNSPLTTSIACTCTPFSS